MHTHLCIIHTIRVHGVYACLAGQSSGTWVYRVCTHTCASYTTHMCMVHMRAWLTSLVVHGCTGCACILVHHTHHTCAWCICVLGGQSSGTWVYRVCTHTCASYTTHMCMVHMRAWLTSLVVHGCTGCACILVHHTHHTCAWCICVLGGQSSGTWVYRVCTHTCASYTTHMCMVHMRA